MQWDGPGILGFSHPDPWVGMHKHNPCMHHKQQPHAGTPSTTWILRVRMIWHFPLSQSFFRSHVRTNSIKSSWQHSFVKWLHFSSFFNMAGYNKPPFAGVQKTSWISVASYSWLIQIDLQYTCHLLSMEIGCNTVTQSKPSLDNVWIGPCLSTGKPVDSEGEEGSLHKKLHRFFTHFVSRVLAIPQWSMYKYTTYFWGLESIWPETLRVLKLKAVPAFEIMDGTQHPGHKPWPGCASFWKKPPSTSHSKMAKCKKTTTHSTGIMFSYRQDSSIATALKTWPFLDQGHLPLLCAFH